MKEVEEHKQEALTNWDLPPAIAARMGQVEVHEKEIEKKIDQVASTFAKKAGYDSVPWFTLTWYLLWLYTVLTIFVMFLRPDFINLTICVSGLYMMFNTDRITKGRFRMLVLGIIITIVYDLLWFFLKTGEYTLEQKNDDSGEAGVRKFSLLMSYASFILRVILNWIKTFSFSLLWFFGKIHQTSLKSSKIRKACLYQLKKKKQQLLLLKIREYFFAIS